MEPSKTIQGKLARASRKDSGVSESDIAALRRDWAASKIAEFVRRELRFVDPLTSEQIDAINRNLRKQPSH